MRTKAVLVVATVAVAVLVQAEPSRAWPPRHGLAFSPAERGVADELALCHHPWGVPRVLLRRAVVRVAEVQACGATEGLSQIVDDDRRDDLTRALAALAIGEIRCHGAGRSGLSASTIGSLQSATMLGQPASLRQAAVRALGRAGVVGAVSTLVPLRTSDPDPVVQFLAAQALTRITRTDYFDAALRDGLLDRYIAAAETYEIREVAP